MVAALSSRTGAAWTAAIYAALYLSRDWWFLYHWDADWGFSHALMLANVRRNLDQPYDEILDEVRGLLTNFARQPAASSGMAKSITGLRSLSPNASKRVSEEQMIEGAACTYGQNTDLMVIRVFSPAIR